MLKSGSMMTLYRFWSKSASHSSTHRHPPQWYSWTVAFLPTALAPVCLWWLAVSAGIVSCESWSSFAQTVSRTNCSRRSPFDSSATFPVPCQPFRRRLPVCRSFCSTKRFCCSNGRTFLSCFWRRWSFSWSSCCYCCCCSRCCCSLPDLIRRHSSGKQDQVS